MGLAEAPADTKDPRAASYIVDQVKPGTTFSRRFQVCNGTNSPITVRLYSNAATVRGGAFTAVEGRVSNELSSWVSVSPSSVTVPSGKRVIAQATIAVPPEAASGERYAVILAELPARQAQSGVAVASRVGIRVYLDVNTGTRDRTDFSIDSLQASRRADGTPVVSAQVHNTGQRALDMRGSLKLTDGPGGLSAGPFPAKLGTTLAPGESEPVTVELDRALPDGPWLARIDLASGLLHRAAEATISFPTKNGTESPSVRAKDVPLAKDRGVLIPIAGALIGLVLLGLLLLLLFAKRRSRTDGNEPDA